LLTVLVKLLFKLGNRSTVAASLPHLLILPIAKQTDQVTFSKIAKSVELVSSLDLFQGCLHVAVLVELMLL
jgi:hypothetical protein